ncbi:MAG: cell division protein FtsQ/DivIB [Nitrosospira sp.]|nr:cell division protein FtsQ/DivIB [Nitrosospira sp.]
MWDNHHALDLLANSLFVLVALAAIYAASQWAAHLPVFPLKEVRVSGINGIGGIGGELKHVTREQINDAVRSEFMGNFFAVDLDAVCNAFRKLPWVRGATARRQWPPRLEVKLEEHVALARWGSTALVNTHGEIFNAASGEKLPVFQGPEESARDMVRQYAVFSKLLRPLRQNIQRINLSPRRAWQVQLDNGTMLELGREQMKARLERYVLAHDRGIAPLNQQLSYVDLRYPSGFAVR